VARPAYLVDTDWIIDHLCGIAPVSQKLQALEPAGLAISIISLAELYEGVHYSRDPQRSMAALQQFVAGVVVLPIDEAICDLFGKERGRLRKLGRTIGDCDLFIACTAICHGAALCTNNRRHFEMVEGLALMSLQGSTP
jgi:tRNA(fMet)-specific endonuclease VapC